MTFEGGSACTALKVGVKSGNVAGLCINHSTT